MLIDNKQEYHAIWDKVYEKLKFRPSYYDRGHSMNVPLPFEIDRNYTVYDIEQITEEQIDLTQEIIRNILISITSENQRLYALDWQHDAFIFNPRNIEEQKDYSDGKYNRYFPGFIPDGDYYFFIDEDFEFGYLGHPWRQEIWIFGDQLIEKIEEVYPQLGWKKIK